MYYIYRQALAGGGVITLFAQEGGHFLPPERERGVPQLQREGIRRGQGC